MVAGDTILAHARPWWSDHRHELTRIGATILSFALAWWVATLNLSTPVWAGVVAYAAAHLLLLGPITRWFAGRTLLLAGMAVLIDALFALLLLSEAHSIGSAIYPLYVLIALRVLSGYPHLPASAIVPFVLGPTYLFAYALSQQQQASAIEQGAQWLLMVGSLAFGAVAIWSSAGQQRIQRQLRQELQEAKAAADIRVAQLERTANDLRTRMRQQYVLEEGLRVITSSLSLDEVLSQIGESTIEMLGRDRVYGLLLSLHTGDAIEHHSFLFDPCDDCTWGDVLVERVVAQQVPVIIGDVGGERSLDTMVPHGVRSLLSVPLFVGDGAPSGALTVVSSEFSAFSSIDARHLIAFAIQAGIAISNAEMHSRLRGQQRLLEAVVRDISDGLLVIDGANQIVLANPEVRAILDQPLGAVSVRERLLSLAESMRVHGNTTFVSEIQLDPVDDEVGRAFQALASLVRQSPVDEPLIAVVLHDVTDHKLEERTRTEFISMVSHELRNPLNSLNGFLKIVLQGRAGPLTPLQEEFLQIVDGQVEQLKGRISELIEYNRVNAGRLKLDPQRNDLPLLIAGTVTRLRIMAEQAGLELINDVGADLPECLFDSERIGQVVTNLIENAIKATPPGGTIWISSELHADEIWVHVSDTGVGIPLEEQNKIFKAFHRAHDRTSSQGNHLGLGLAICRQIIEGHNGRIWVESEEGRGSRFSFALPLTLCERSVNG